MINCLVSWENIVRCRAEMEEVMCPSCGEWFAVSVPPRDECPAVLDYDCEVCCRPLLLDVDEDGQVLARGTGD